MVMASFFVFEWKPESFAHEKARIIILRDGNQKPYLTMIRSLKKKLKGEFIEYNIKQNLLLGQKITRNSEKLQPALFLAVGNYSLKAL